MVFRFSNPDFRSPPRRRGFTLVEMLVVVGIIAIVTSVLLVGTSVAKRAARKARTSADMQTIGTALEAYKQDFGDYPRLDYSASAVPAGTTNPAMLFGNPAYISSTELLAWALIGPYDATVKGPWSPKDGKDGLGFRVGVNARGTVYGPYLDPERFLRNPANDPPDVNQMSRYYFFVQDNFRQPILYFVRNVKPLSNAGIDLYNFNDNGIAFVRAFPADANAIPRFQKLVERHKPEGPYLLWSAGEDENFAVEDPNDAAAVEKCDDVLYWGGQ